MWPILALTQVWLSLRLWCVGMLYGAERTARLTGSKRHEYGSHSIRAHSRRTRRVHAFSNLQHHRAAATKKGAELCARRVGPGADVDRSR
jgi:hypothetical protein